MKAKELIERLTELLDEENLGTHEFAVGDYSDDFATLLAEELGEFDDFEGDLLDSDEGWTTYQYVYHFKKHNVYIGVTTLYHSWADEEEGEIYEVKPVETIVYERVETEEDVG